MAQSAASRILVLGSSYELAAEIISRTASLESVQEDSNIVPWTISNKYYTAAVHFQRTHWSDVLSLDEEEGIPAVIVAWKKGENYRQALLEIVDNLDANAEPQVLLSVVLGHTSEEIETVEAFCSEKGFELIDGDAVSDDTERKGYDRIREALSIVMWPNMQRPSSSRHVAGKRSRSYTLTQATANLDTPELNVAELVSFETTIINEEKTEPSLVRPPATPSSWPSRSDGKDEDDTKPTPIDAFEDDFSDFISAGEGTFSQFHTRINSDDEGDDAVSDKEDDLEEPFDADMPPEQDILMTSHRIFGPSLPSTKFGTNDSGSEMQDDDEEEFSLDAFDLGSIMGALQNLKEEIAGIGDETRRREAAAKVALGLIWGLEGVEGLTTPSGKA